MNDYVKCVKKFKNGNGKVEVYARLIMFNVMASNSNQRQAKSVIVRVDDIVDRVLFYDNGSFSYFEVHLSNQNYYRVEAANLEAFEDAVIQALSNTEKVS